MSASSELVMDASLDLSVVIVNWNTCDLLRRCLHSILASAIPEEDEVGVWRLESIDSPSVRFELLVVDSASSDNSVTMVRQEFPAVRLYPSQVNLGYTGGNNLGLSESRGRYVLLLNADTEVLGKAFGALVTYADAHPDVGVVGPQLLWSDGSVQSSRRRFPSLCTALVESTFIQKWFPGHPVLRRYYVLDRPDHAVSEVDWVTGACILVRRAAFEQVGLLDGTFFMYSEELDWQRRLKTAGWQVVYLPEAQVIHYEGKSSEQVVALRHILFGRSKVLYFHKHHGWFAGEVVRAWLLLNYVYEWAVEAAKWCLGHKRNLRYERLCTYRQVIRSGFRRDSGPLPGS